MNILGSTFGRALAGGGMAAADLANRYITADLQAQRDQAMADIQRNSAVQQAKEIDQYQNDPGRREGLRTESVKDLQAQESTKLKSDIDRASSTELTDAEGRRAGAIAKASATATAEVQRDTTLLNGSDPKYIAALTKIAQANRDPSAVASHAAQTALAQFQLASAKKVASLQDELTEAIANGDAKAEEQARLKLEGLQGKGGKAEKFYAVAEAAGRAMAPALKILADPVADATAKEEAQQTIREQRALMTAAAKRAGVDLTEASRVPEAQAHAQAQAALAAGAPLEAVNKRLQDGGYAPIQAPAGKGGASATAAAPVAPAASTQPSNRTGDAVLNSMTADREQKLAGVAEQYRAAKAELQAAAGSGQQQAAVAAANKLQSIRNEYATLANSLFGNNAQRYIDKLNSI